MAKTLVIKGSNYTANKLDTVVFDDVIPCTGISFAEVSADVEPGDTYSIVATVTPADTTDEIVWSSNNQYFSVNNGEVSVNGIGQATITAVCGEYSASVVLTSTAEYDADDFDSVTGREIAYVSDYGSLNTAYNSRKTYGRVNENDYHLLWGSAESKTDAMTFCPAFIPIGSAKMTVEYNSTAYTKVGFADMNTECSAGYGGVEIVASDSQPVQAESRDINIPEGANGFYISTYDGDSASLKIIFS